MSGKLVAAFVFLAAVSTASPSRRALGGDAKSPLDPDMARVMDALASLGGKPIETLTPEEARRQPTPADAAAKVAKERAKDTGKMAPADAGVTTREVTIAGSTGALPGRVYAPSAAKTPPPLIVYFHGGGFVFATIDTYDASARALVLGTGAAVLSVEYRKAPEHKFPAAHDDANAAYEWASKNAAALGVDVKRIALVGESAGGNLALNVAIAARDRGWARPLHVVAVYPVAGTSMETPSYREHAAAKPLNKPMMEWFFRHATSGPQDAKDPRLDLVGRADLKGLPPVTVITAEVDPLRSDGSMLVEALTKAGVPVKALHYTGVVHEFFGMGDVVAKAKEAQDAAAAELKAAFR